MEEVPVYPSLLSCFHGVECKDTCTYNSWQQQEWQQQQRQQTQQRGCLTPPLPSTMPTPQPPRKSSFFSAGGGTLRSIFFIVFIYSKKSIYFVDSAQDEGAAVCIDSLSFPGKGTKEGRKTWIPSLGAPWNIGRNNITLSIMN